MPEPTDYAMASLRTLSEDASAVRKRPGMYVGSTGPDGLNHLLEELVDNAADQFLMGLATWCAIDVRQVDGRWVYTVEDDGAGLPFDREEEGRPIAEHYATRLHFTATRDDHTPHVHRGGLHGVGIAAIWALCEHVEVQSWRDGRRYRMALSRGTLVEPTHVVEDGEGRGTCIRMVPDREIFGDATPDLALFRARLFESVHLLRGWRVDWNGERFHSRHGLVELAPLLIPTRHSRRTAVHRWRDDNLRGEVAAFGTASCSGEPTRVVGWCNGAVTEEGGSHVDGVRRVLDDLPWTPAIALVHVVFDHPRYAGPTRGKLEVDWVEEAVVAACRSADFGDA